MPKRKTSRKTHKPAAVAQPVVMHNQFFGMVLVAIGIGALIVVLRYFIISLQVPTDVYMIQTEQLIPGAK